MPAMSAPAVFTLSLDCEGLWGMADQVDFLRSGVIRQDSLADAYDFIRRVLDENGILATCAFVSAFAAGPTVLKDHVGILRQLGELSPGWFQHILPALSRGEADGWSGTAFYEALRASGHEMAWHGATHLSLADSTPAAAVELELELARQLFEVLGHQPTTIVFPRNEVGQLARLRDEGFTTYRARAAGGVAGRVARLAREWHVLDQGSSEMPSRRDGWEVAPPGDFLNWPSGVRSLVPVSVTVARWRSMLSAAVSKGRQVHMWFHPHNLITAPAMRDSFAAVMRQVGGLLRSGELRNETMRGAAALYGKQPRDDHEV